MSAPGIPQNVQHLIWNQLHTVDHVAVLLAVRTIGRADVAAVAAHTTLEMQLVAHLLQELHHRSLLTRQGAEYQLHPDAALGDTVAQLAELYNTRPVTLVRAIYNRPAHNIQQFADAFRLRQPEGDE